MVKQWVVLLLCITFFTLVACHSPVYDQAETNVANVKLRMAALRQKSNDDAKAKPALVVSNGLYVDSTPISLEREPTWLRSHIIIRGDQLPFSYYSRTIAAGSYNHVLTKYQTGLDPAVNTSLNFSGTIKGALDLLASKTGYIYTIHGNHIYWKAFVTKTYDVAFMPGSSDYLMGKAAGGSSSAANTSQGASNAQVSNYVSSDSSDSEFSNLKGTISIWKDLQTTIPQLLSPDGKVTVSESTTSVTVRDRPTNVDLVGQYIRNLNSKLSRQVLVKVQILQVNLENSWDFGIDWNVVTKSFHNSNFAIQGNYGTPITLTTLTTQPTGVVFPQIGSVKDPTKTEGYTILFKALSQQGKTSVVAEPRVVCLNNQVSVVRITKSEGYAASIQNTSLAGSGTTGGTNNIGTVTSQVTPGMLVTGFTLYILPKIMGNRVYLQVNADLSTNDGFKTFGQNGVDNPNSTQIQLPNTTSKSFNQRSMIRSGDSLILAGFRQLSNIANANQFIKSQALGGKAASQVNAETVILITPIILDGCA